MQRHLAAHVVGELVGVELVRARQDHRAQTGAVRRQHLLLHATDGQHPSVQCDLTGHADVGAHLPLREIARQCCGHRDAGRRSVLRDATRGEVHVEATVHVSRVDAECRGVCPEVRQRDLARLAHHFAELTGQREPGFARHGGGFDEQHVSAGTGHGETGRDTGHGDALDGLVLGDGTAEVRRGSRRRDRDGRSGAVRDRGRGLAHQPVESLLETTYTRFGCVAEMTVRITSSVSTTSSGCTPLRS